MLNEAAGIPAKDEWYMCSMCFVVAKWVLLRNALQSLVRSEVETRDKFLASTAWDALKSRFRVVGKGLLNALLRAYVMQKL